MNNKNMSYAKNIQSINFDNKTERKGKQNFKKSVINCVGLTLSNKILDYMKKGGDIENLTPYNINWILIYFIDNHIVVNIIYLIETFFI